ncbi:N5-glutamine S-adenosyl-L-methionine-dependent methyltransferase [Moraxella macacae 0408225]|uniref:Release factor glutamine methyltransferase n=1 Tax=Moraxella macacae 0408225 TaxID=1230338 RepID=L2F725_9GAMM|nr:peptide chain release factor N(5)-glutamine methyltransferase [Moraxella macacae]ELA08258.1 N5-glutamine S-adenosyl-L-methionine-dependent methyltransferase [Moraxella macacae 0408225]
MQIKTLLKNNFDHHLNRQLLMHVLQKDRTFLISHDDYCLTDVELQNYQDGLNALKNGKPLAYIVGYQGFWKHDFLVNAHTLIPRPDTEILVQTVLNFIKTYTKTYTTDKDNTPLKLLDLGTGTGCIGISLASELPNWQVVAVDFSDQALHIAKKNAKNIGTNNITFVTSDWFCALQEQKFDVIVANPPYIDPNDEHLQDLTAEPIRALVADNQGLADIETIVNQAKFYLHDQGLLAIEHGYNQGKQVQQIFQQNNFCGIKTVQDYGLNDRITLGRLA